MPSTSHSTTSNDQCEHCHTTYTLVKRKKSCAVCRQYYCTTCAPRERHYNQPYRICLICQLISSDSTTDEQLLALKVKHLRCYLQAKNVAYHTCTEKQELVDLIVRNRHAPFTRLFIQQQQQTQNFPPPPPPPPPPTTNSNQQQFHTTFNQFSTSTSASSSSSSSTTTTAMPPPPPPPQPPKHGNFTNFQHTMSSFASQMNHFAANLQDYVTNTVSGVLHHALGDHQQTTTTTTTTNNGNGTSSTFNFGTTANGPFTYSFSSPGNFVYTTTTNSTTASPQQQRRTTTTTNETTASSNTQQQTSTPQRPRRKSLSELNNEQNIEDLGVRELKEILIANFVDYKGCVEKNELIEKVRRLYRDRQNEKIKAKELDSATASDSELCKVCMDAIADCVFLDCGHMVTCVKCGKLLAECPICRSNIVRVVRVFKS
jgi:hypothetical protein